MGVREWLVLMLLVCASPASAGVYNLSERLPHASSSEVRGLVLQVRSAALPSKSSLRPEHFKYQVQSEANRLEAVQRDGIFSTLDRVSLAGCYLRLGEPDKAIRLLERGDRSHFLLLLNLAAAYFQTGDAAMAVRYQEQALKVWPEVFFAWSERELRRYRKCERALLNLYRFRAEESRGRPIRENLDIDPVFPGLRYVNTVGEFQPGALSQEMLDRLPDDAVDVLTQLAVWFPTDMRLYWQLGLLLSSVGVIDQAAAIADELVDAGMARSFKGLPQQRRALREAMLAFKVLGDPIDPAPRGQLLATLLLVPRPLMAPPIVGDAAYAAACTGVVPAMLELSKPPIPSFATAQQDPFASGGSANQAVFNFSHLALAFFFGMLVAALIALQRSEWRRRQRMAAAHHHQQALPQQPSE